MTCWIIKFLWSRLSEFPYAIPFSFEHKSPDLFHHWRFYIFVHGSVSEFLELMRFFSILILFSYFLYWYGICYHYFFRLLNCYSSLLNCFKWDFCYVCTVQNWEFCNLWMIKEDAKLPLYFLSTFLNSLSVTFLYLFSHLLQIFFIAQIFSLVLDGCSLDPYGMNCLLNGQRHILQLS